MLGLPVATELRKPIFKKMVFDKFKFSAAEKQEFDKYIKQLHIAGEISPKTVNIAGAGEIRVIFLLQVTLKEKECPDRLLIHIAKLIEQKMVLVLSFANEIQLTIYHHGHLQRSAWQAAEAGCLKLQGLDMAAVWENFVLQIGGIELEQGNSLDRQLEVNETREKLAGEIARLSKKMWSARQPKAKLELRQKINELQKEIDTLNL